MCGQFSAGLVVEAVRQHGQVVRNEDIVELQRAAVGRPHAHDVPFAEERHALGFGWHGKEHGVLRDRLDALLLQRADQAVMAGGAGERGEMLDAVDPVAALDRPRRGAERRLARGCRAVRLGKGLGEQHALLDDPAEQGGAPDVVLRAHIVRHLQLVRQARRPQQCAGMHVESERGGRAPAAQFGGDQGVGLVVGAHAAMILGDRHGQEAGLPEIGVVLEREDVAGVQIGGAGAEPVAAQFADAADQVFLPGGRVRPVDIHERLRHPASPGLSGSCRETSFRKRQISALNAAGSSMLARWPAPARQR